MALSDLSFKLYQNAILTVPFGGILSLTHQSDLSDGPQDFVLYFGSNTLAGSVQLQASVNPGVDNIELTPVDTLPEWVATTAVSLAETVEPTVDNARRYVVSTAGTTGGAEPTWPTAIGSTVADGTVIWTCASETHSITEVKLASTLAGLDSATGGAPLSLGHTALSGEANLQEIHIRVTNTVTTTGSNAGRAEIGISIDSVQESAV